jgi:hypothetical protein
MNLRPIKACHNCGASYTLPMWDQLQPIVCAVPGPERRRCACGNELALDRAAAESVSDALPPPEHTASQAAPPAAALAIDDKLGNTDDFAFAVGRAVGTAVAQMLFDLGIVRPGKL